MTLGYPLCIANSAQPQLKVLREESAHLEEELISFDGWPYMDKERKVENGKTMRNSQIMSIMKAMTDDAGKALFKKRLPAKLLYALRRSTPEIEKAYKVYATSLTDICGQYSTTPDKLQCGAAEQQEQLMGDLSELLATETEVNVYAVPPEVLDKCGEGVYDPLTYAEIDRLWWLIDEEEG